MRCHLDPPVGQVLPRSVFPSLVGWTHQRATICNGSTAHGTTVQNGDMPEKPHTVETTKTQFWSPKPATQRPIRSRQVLRCPAPPHLRNGDSAPLFCQAKRADTAAEPRSNDDEVEVVLRSVTWHRDSLS